MIKFIFSLIYNAFGKRSHCYYGNAELEKAKNSPKLIPLTIGYGSQRIGVNSEKVKHAIQDRAIHGIIKDAGFENQSWQWNSYYHIRTRNRFTSW